jgi:hypothetical protein
MTPSQTKFYGDALSLIRSEWKAMAPRTGDAAAWWWVEKLTGWNGAHDWSVQRIQYDRTLTLPFHLLLTDCIELTQDAASEVLRKLKVPLAVRERQAEEERLAALGKKRNGRPRGF